jgi:hypothetical protein
MAPKASNARLLLHDARFRLSDVPNSVLKVGLPELHSQTISTGRVTWKFQDSDIATPQRIKAYVKDINR